MPVQKVIGNTTYTVPTSNDRGWSQTTTSYLLALGTYANQVAKAAYDLTTNFKLNSPVVVSDSKNVASYGLEAPFIQIRNYTSSSQAKFGALRLPVMGNTYNEVSSTNTTYNPTGVSAHNQINWALGSGYVYLHADNHATLGSASLVIQRIASTNSPITDQTALATALADGSNLNVDKVVLVKEEVALKGKTLDTSGSGANFIRNTALATAQVALWEGTYLVSSAVTKNELGTLTGINTGSTVQTRLAALESSSTTTASDIGNIGSLAAGLFAKTTNNTSPTADVYTSRTLTGTANKIVITDGDGVSGNPTFTVGTDIVTLTDTQTLSNKSLNVGSNNIIGTTSTLAQFNGSGNLTGSNTVPNNISFVSGQGIESVSGTLNVGTTSTDTLNLGTMATANTINIGTGAGTSTINIGGAGDTINIAGTLTTINTTNVETEDQTITVNKGGTAAATAGAGISIEGGGSEVGYIRSDSPRTGTEFKSDQRSGTSTIRHSSSATTNVLDLTSSNGNTYSFPASTGDVVVTTAEQTHTGKKTFNTLAYIAEAATVATANLAPASTPPRAIQRITSSTATLGTITNTGGSTNTELILINATGSAISVLNDSGASSTSILTGTGSAISLLPGATITVVYDLSSSRWRVINGYIPNFASGIETFLATPSSANLASAVTDETGSGKLVFSDSPEFSTKATIKAGGELRLNNAGDTFYTGFKSGNAAANKIWTLPLVDGSPNQVLSTDGSATLQWSTVATDSTTQHAVKVGDSGGTAQQLRTNLLGRFQAEYTSATATMTIATPGVVTYTAHGRVTGDRCYFTTTGALPTGVSANTTYWITKVDADTFKLSTSLANCVAGTFVATSGSQSGTHTIYVGGIGVVDSYPASLTGTSPASGYIGQVITSAASETTTSGIAGATLGTLSLTKGSWEVFFLGAVTNSSGTITGVEWSTQLTTNSSLNPSVLAYYNEAPNAVGGNCSFPTSNQARGFGSSVVQLDLVSDTTYYLRSVVSITGGGSVAIKGFATATRRA
jgi:hypothetical protein